MSHFCSLFLRKLKHFKDSVLSRFDREFFAIQNCSLFSQIGFFVGEKGKRLTRTQLSNCDGQKKERMIKNFVLRFHWTRKYTTKFSIKFCVFWYMFQNTRGNIWKKNVEVNVVKISKKDCFLTRTIPMFFFNSAQPKRFRYLI